VYSPRVVPATLPDSGRAGEKRATRVRRIGDSGGSIEDSNRPCPSCEFKVNKPNERIAEYE
jgi:hypothetical protein